MLSVRIKDLTNVVLKYLTAPALIAATAGTATSQVPEPCQVLHIDKYEFAPDPNNKRVLYLNASIHNDSPYVLTFASFSFHVLADDDKTVLGETSQSIGRLLQGEIMPVHMNVI